jgi:hypothetical protein
MLYDPVYLSNGHTDLTMLGADTSVAALYLTFNQTRIPSGGALYDRFLTGHQDAKDKTEELLVAVRSLYERAGERITETMDSYATTESGNESDVQKIWNVLDATGSDPVTPLANDPAGSPTAGPLPSTCLDAPSTNLDHWIFQILSWPDYLSIGSWARKIFGWIWSAFTGQDPWNQLWGFLGGDWEAVGLSSSAWAEFGEYFSTTADELVTRMTIMFGGWYDSDGATAAGEYFARASQAVESASGPMGDLSTLYHDVAWSSYMLCQAVYSLIDAAIDAIVAYLMGGVTVAEAIAAFFSGGVTAIPAAVTAVIAAVEALSAAWGWMMTAVYGVTGLAALLGAATTEVTWVAIPAG